MSLPPVTLSIPPSHAIAVDRAPLRSRSAPPHEAPQDVVVTPPPSADLPPEDMLDKVERSAFNYFWENADPETGLVLDRASNVRRSDLHYSAASIAAVGFGLTAVVIAARHGWISEEAAQQRIATTLETFRSKVASIHGFYYHFVDPHTGQRAWNSEVSPMDTALFLAGALTAAQAYPGSRIEKLAQDLYGRVDWPWMRDGGTTLRYGWTPEHGFIPGRWDHYDESSLMDILAIGSPTHPVPPDLWRAVERHPVSYGGHEFLQSPQLFTHQYSQLWLDLRGQTDGRFDYFQSSREATLANRQFAIDHPSTSYGPDSWGLTASDGPDGYRAYGAPPGDAPEDGTVAPTGALGSYEFTPQESYAALRHMAVDLGPQLWGRYGLTDAYNLDRNWVDTDVLGIDQGAELISIENARSGMVWQLFRAQPDVQNGLHQAGFHLQP